MQQSYASEERENVAQKPNNEIINNATYLYTYKYTYIIDLALFNTGVRCD
jgi:hypothetical protein